MTDMGDSRAIYRCPNTFSMKGTLALLPGTCQNMETPQRHNLLRTLLDRLRGLISIKPVNLTGDVHNKAQNEEQPDCPK